MAKPSVIKVFGPEVDSFGMRCLQFLSEKEAQRYGFHLLCKEAETRPTGLTFLIATLQEGDGIPIDVLELLEVNSGATYVVDSFVRGHELMFFKLLRHRKGDGEFRLLGLNGPKARRER